MERRSLGSILPKLERRPWGGIHEVGAVGSGFVCLHRACPFASKDLSEAVGHAVSNQYVVRTQDEPREEGEAR